MRWRGERRQGFGRVMRVGVCAMVGVGWLALAALVTGVTPARAADAPSLSIIIPVPTGSATSGPVGANVTITASGLSSADKYSLGYASSAGPTPCVTGSSDMGLTPFSPNGDGTIQMTFAWPSAAKDTGTPYVICLQDATLLGTPPVQSTTTFQVLDTQAPKIEIKHVAQSVGPGTPTPAPQPNGAYAPSDIVQITGSHFPPGGLGGNPNLGFYLTTSPVKTFSDLSQGQSLTLTSGAVAPDPSGTFTSRVALPTTQANGAPFTTSGQFYLYVVSSDANNQPSALPSLVAFRQITIAPAPTPTPTATATNTPSVTASPSATPGGHTGGGSSSNLGLVIGLGALSVVLFIVGVILLASAASLPRGGQF